MLPGGIFKGAVKDRRLVASTSVDGIDLLASVKKPNTYLTAKQLGALAEERAGTARWCSCWPVGLRIGEALGLTLGDIDFLAAAAVTARVGRCR